MVATFCGRSCSSPRGGEGGGVGGGVDGGAVEAATAGGRRSVSNAPGERTERRNGLTDRGSAVCFRCLQ